MVKLRSWETGMPSCGDNKELAQRHNNSCDVSLCVSHPGTADELSFGVELKMVATSPSRPSVRGRDKH